MVAQEQARSWIEFAVEDAGGTVVIRLGENVDSSHAAELCEYIATLATFGKEIVIDLTDVQRLDDACLAVLADAWAEARRNGHTVTWRSCPDPDPAPGDGARRRPARWRRHRRPATRPGRTADRHRVRNEAAAPVGKARHRRRLFHRSRRVHAHRWWRKRRVPPLGTAHSGGPSSS
jgi:anti-anti-sigma factor